MDTADPIHFYLSINYKSAHRRLTCQKFCIWAGESDIFPRHHESMHIKHLRSTFG